MTTMNRLDRLFVFAAFLIQVVLVIFFALRTRNLTAALRVGWIVYALAIPALAVSIHLMRAGRPWFVWLAGFLYGAWAVFGYLVDVARPLEWRSPILWPVFLPYVLLYVSRPTGFAEVIPAGRVKRGSDDRLHSRCLGDTPVLGTLRRLL